MKFELYKSKEDISNQKNPIQLGIEELLERSNFNEILVCSDGFSENRARSGIPTPHFILSSEGNYIEKLGMKRFDLKRKVFYQTCGSTFFIDDIKDEESRMVYTEMSHIIRTGDWDYSDEMLILPGYYINDDHKRISEYCSDMNIMENCILRTSLLQRVFTQGEVFYTIRKSGEFIKALSLN